MTPILTTADRLLTAEQAAKILAVKPQTLAIWRCAHRHDLRFVRVGRSIRYRLSDLNDWLDAHTVGGPESND